MVFMISIQLENWVLYLNSSYILLRWKYYEMKPIHASVSVSA